MLHPIDYRLSKNKFWLSTWNSYSLKNYKNLILNDKILNVLGYIFKNCFKVSYSFASPWSNPRKHRKYFSNFIIGFDGRRAIKTGPNKVKKLPGFLIPEDYSIIRFYNFSILKIYFLIDKNLETYWAKKHKNWRSPLKYFNMRYNKNKSMMGNQLRLNKNLVNSNIEKKNFKITGFFVYLFNLLNNNSVKQKFYFNLSDQIDFFKRDKKHLYFRFYYDNLKLLNKVRNNYFLFYIVNKKNSIYTNNNLKSIFLKTKILKSETSTTINRLYFSHFNNIKKVVTKNQVCNNPLINYSDYNKFSKLNNYNIDSKLGFLNNLTFYKKLLNNNQKPNHSFSYSSKNKVMRGIKSYFLYTRLDMFKRSNKSTPFENFLTKKLKSISFNKYKCDFNDSKKLSLDLNVSRKRGLTLFLKTISLDFYKRGNTKQIPKALLFKNKNLLYPKIYKTKQNNNNFLGFTSDCLKSRKNMNLFILYNRFAGVISGFCKGYNSRNDNLNYKKQNYYNLKYFHNSFKKFNSSNLLVQNLDNFKKILYFDKNFLNGVSQTNKYKYFFLKNYSSQNWSVFSNLLNLNIKSNRKSKNSRFILNKRSKYRNQKVNWCLNKSFIKNNIQPKTTLSFNDLVLKKNIYLFLTNFKSNKINELYKCNKKSNNDLNSFKAGFNTNNRVNIGNISLVSTNYNKKKNYFYDLVDCDHLYSNIQKKKIIPKINEYKVFLRLQKFKIFGLNPYSINNFNYGGSIGPDYFSLFNNKKRISSNYIFYSKSHKQAEVSNFKNLMSLNELKWDSFKTVSPKHLFNSYFKKTFFHSFGNQNIFTQDNFDKINYRLEGLNTYKLQKFKPYTFKSISKLHRYKYNKSVLTKYITNEVKYNAITIFLNSMENKKTIHKKNVSYKSFKIWFSNLMRAKGSILLGNLSFSKFNKLKSFNYSFFSFMKKFERLMFLNKNIKSKDKFLLNDSKKKIKKYLSNYYSLSIQKNSFSNYLEKLQFKYFKRVKKSFKIHNSKDIIIIPYKSLLSNINLNSISKNSNKNLFTGFKSLPSKNFKINSIISSNSYKYKINIYSYFTSNRGVKLKRFYLPISINKHVKYVAPLVFKNSFINSKVGYKKSNNMVINKYMRTRLSNIFLNSKVIYQLKNKKKTQVEGFNYRVYGLSKKISDVKFLNKKEFKKINKLQPKAFLYWNHLKWFNTFIKTKFNFKLIGGYNNYNSFKLYENFKNLNFYYYKNFKKYTNNTTTNHSQLLSGNYGKLNNFVFYSTLFKFRSSFLYFSNKKSFHKKKLLANWSYDILFSSTVSKRLNYIPHIRFKPIKNSLYMWRINSRKLNLLLKYFRARTKFFQKKLNFVSNYSKRSSILSYLKLMESNFLRIKKSMQRELPLINIKRYLLGQLKKLNNYIRILTKRQKKRSYFKYRNQKTKLSRGLKNSTLKISFTHPSILNDNKYIFKRLYNFVNKRFFLGKKNLIDYVKKFIEHLFLVIFKFNHLRIFYIKKYQINIMSTKAKLFKNLFNYRLATGFKVPFLVKVICKKLNFDKSLVGCKIGFFGRYSKKLRNRKLWKYVKQLKPSVISTPLDYYNILILQKWGITGIKLSILRKKTFNFIFN